MHMLSKKGFNSGEVATLRRSKNTTMVVTANGEVQTNEEAQENVHDLDLFVTVQILNDTPAGLSLGKLCEEHGYSCEWASGQKPHLTTKDGKNVLCKTENFVPLWSQDFRHVPAQVHPRHAGFVESSNPASHDVTRKLRETAARKLLETACRVFPNGWTTSQKISKTQKCQHPQTFLMSQIRNVSKKCETQYPLPERPKLRGLQANQDYKGPLQKVNC